MTVFLHRLASASLIAVLAWAPLGSSSAQDAGAARSGGQAQASSGAAGIALPSASVTRHTIDLPGRSLRYTATAGALPVRDQSSRVLAEIAYVSYALDRESAGVAAERPVTFAVNGGPGAASAYLHLGLMGPRRLPFGRQGDTPSSPTDLVGNAETWLDFTDLVFIDPVGAGFSRFAPGNDDARGLLWSAEGDYKSLSRFIANWLRLNGRLGSPKFIVGESLWRLPRAEDRQ